MAGFGPLAHKPERDAVRGQVEVAFVEGIRQEAGHLQNGFPMHSSGHKLTYRPEIDGMRCIAVAAVLIYHLKITVAGSSILPGGFLGVDLFFVLSGFLITKILLEELQTQGRISFGRFYARRARRILPPLLLVMLVSLPVALAVLLPSELSRFGSSLIANLFS
ncbi:hypothetical protein C8024_14130 [Sphingopyxis sp. BSNA05]|uniref:acyltransferase family protein n=1 Tax=Sphingopyxis sp. BSNA05 TaxID=1236614 RepID=UPI001562F653|nr:acyltransferase [Sphingopyxis sp. BSNA05]NRD90355.1 hypothetical protein [Sphingopyxis sp. BSNA05]